MLQRDPGATLLVEACLTKTGHIRGASSLDLKSVQSDRTHQSQAYEADLFWQLVSFKAEDVYKKVCETTAETLADEVGLENESTCEVLGNSCR